MSKSEWIWWRDVILGTLEMGFFVASAGAGFALLRRWRRSRVAICVLAALWLAFCAYIISSTEGGLPIVDIFWGPFTLIAIYSLVALPLIAYERKPA